jgi:hypothetical protein
MRRVKRGKARRHAMPCQAILAANGITFPFTRPSLSSRSFLHQSSSSLIRLSSTPKFLSFTVIPVAMTTIQQKSTKSKECRESDESHQSEESGKLEDSTPMNVPEPDDFVPIVIPNITFAPNNPRQLPPLTDRINFLRELVMKPESELDRENILAILSLYEEGKLQQGQVVYAQDGQIFYEQPALKPGKAIWVEVGFRF